MIPPSKFLMQLYQRAVAAAHPRICLPPYLPAERNGAALVVGAGKAAAAMAKVFEDNWLGPVRGLVITRHGHNESCRAIRVVEAGHPLPDQAGRQATEDMLTLLRSRKANEQIYFLASGGGSALLTQPVAAIDIEEKRLISAALLRSGAAIDEINCVRKHLSALKGGKLAALCEPSLVTTFAISDVPGNDPAVISSGPTVADPTTSAQALAILHRYQIPISPAVTAWLHNPDSETPKPGSLLQHPFHLIATPINALQAAAEYARECGIMPIVLGDHIEGEAREVAKVMAGIAKSMQDIGEPARPPCVLLSGGETSVTVRGEGKGGRNTEFLLGLALALRSRDGIYALAADSDGIDGSEDNAGAFLYPDSLQRARALSLDAGQLLAQNDSYRFFSALGDLLITGPTRTNVNDLRVIYLT